MGYYKKQFIEEIVNSHLDARLITFFKSRKKIFPEEDIYEFVSDLLDEYFHGTMDKSELLFIINKTKNTRKSKRRRWYNNFMDAANTLDINDPTHPLAPTITLANTLPFDKYVEVFGDKSIDEIAKDVLLKVDAWINDSDAYMIDFPGVHLYTDNNIYKTFKIDAILNIWKYIENDLGGNILSFEKQYPLELIDKPLFAPSSFSLFMNDASSDLLQEIITDDEGNEILDITVKKGRLTPPKSMTSTEQELVNIFISHVSNIDQEEFFKRHILTIDLQEVAKQMVDYIPGQRTKDMITNCCDRLVQYSYSYEDKDGKMFFNLFDNIIIKNEGEHPIIVVSFGDVLFNAVTQRKLVSITSSHYSLLQNPLSKIICYALKTEQIANQREPRTERYAYTYFQRIVRFRLRDKRKNIAALKESLQEFVDNNIIIESYEYVNNSFIIKFLPLTSYELEDLSNQRLAIG